MARPVSLRRWLRQRRAVCLRRMECLLCRRRGLRQDQRGAVYFEFLLCFVPVFLLFLAGVQIALLYTANLVGADAALRAARSAIVVLDEDPERHGGVPRGDLLTLGGGDDSGDSWLAAGLGGAAPGNSGASSGSASGLAGVLMPGNSRLRMIRRAAYAPLAALSPSAGRAVSGGALSTIFGASALGRLAVGYALYTPTMTAVTLREAPGSSVVIDQVVSQGLVTLHVTYLYYCQVPLVDRFGCRPLYDLAGFGEVAKEFQKAVESFEPSRPDLFYKRISEIRGRGLNASERQRYLIAEFDRVERPILLAAHLLTGARFVVLEAEVSLPNQGACYHGGCVGGGT